MDYLTVQGAKESPDARLSYLSAINISFLKIAAATENLDQSAKFENIQLKFKNVAPATFFV